MPADVAARLIRDGVAAALPFLIQTPEHAVRGPEETRVSNAIHIS